MQKKLTITLDEKVYDGLHAQIGRGNISRFLERLARPYVVSEDLEAAYGRMAEDQERETHAQEWCDAFAGETLD